MKIILHCGNFDIGYLSFENSKYKFFADSKNFKEAMKTYPIIRNLGLNSSGIGVYEKLPYPFTNYTSALSREDIVLAAKITESDTIFEKLFKLASLNHEHELFWISQ